MNKRLHDPEVVLRNLILKQTVVETVETMVTCLTNIETVKLVNIDMNKKQWARFALEINKSEKKIQSLGEIFIIKLIAIIMPAKKYLVSKSPSKQDFTSSEKLA